MKLAVRSWFFGGIQVGDSPGGQVHHVVDEDSDVEFASFASKSEAEDWLAAMRPHIEAGSLPPMTERELRGVREKLTGMEDSLQEVGTSAVIFALRRWFPRQLDARIGDHGLLQRLAALRKRVGEA